MAGIRQRAATCSRVGFRSMPARPPNDRAAGGAGGTGRPAPCLFPLAPPLLWPRGAASKNPRGAIGLVGILGHNTTNRPRHKSKYLNPTWALRRPPGAAHYITHPTISQPPPVTQLAPHPLHYLS